MPVLHWIRAELGPPLGPPNPREVLRAASGGALALGILGFAALWGGAGFALPLGASAVLVFAVPNSPLAQPWSVVLGNSLSALTGVLVALALPHPVFAPALAFGIALPVMMLTRALHPPGGALAVSAAVLALSGTVSPGWALWPVAGESAFLVLAGILWNRATGRVYPFRVPSGPSQQPPRPPGLDPDHLRDLLTRFRQSANIGVEDLARLIAAAESDAAAHRFGGLTVGEVMTPNPLTVSPDDSAAHLADLIQERGFTSFPVVEDGVLRGIVAQGDLIRGVMARGRRGLTVGQMMSRHLRVLDVSAPVARLLPELADGEIAAVAVLRDGKLAGVVTRSDLLALLTHELALPELTRT